MARNMCLPMCPKWLSLSLFRLIIEAVLMIGKMDIYRSKIKKIGCRFWAPYIVCGKFVLLLQILVQPAEELAIPYHRVLGFEDLMSLVLELNKT